MKASTHTLPLYWLKWIFWPLLMVSTAKSGEGRGTSAAIAGAAARHAPASTQRKRRFSIKPSLSHRRQRVLRAFHAADDAAGQLHLEVSVVAGSGKLGVALGLDLQMLPLFAEQLTVGLEVTRGGSGIVPFDGVQQDHAFRRVVLHQGICAAPPVRRE